MAPEHSLHAEGTDCYRLFHGAVEGRPGLTVDVYGALLLVHGTADENVQLVHSMLLTRKLSQLGTIFTQMVSKRW